MYYGGDYNPEQWPEHVWHEDMELMRQAGVNLVTVGVFSWSRLEPSPDVYDFGWLDRVLDLLHTNGIRVNLATPTAQPPPWFPEEARNVTSDGVRMTHGSRDTYCVSAPPYREKSHQITTKLHERYGQHPALAMWHVHNEYGSWCHCDHTAIAFRVWLRARYGTLNALNNAWTTAFWSQHYSVWDQILPPRTTQYLPNPSQTLDFRRFLSDELLSHFQEQKAILRPSGVPITTNFVFGAWVPVNHREWARHVDLVSIDHYPSEDPPTETAFAANLARSWANPHPQQANDRPSTGDHSGVEGRSGPRAVGPLRADDRLGVEAPPGAGDRAGVSEPPLDGQPRAAGRLRTSERPEVEGHPGAGERSLAGGKGWLLMEQGALTYTEARMLPKRPGEITRLSLSHIARGSLGALFFQWRASRGGAELWHGGMVPHAGPDSRIFREIRELGAMLSRIEGAIKEISRPIDGSVGAGPGHTTLEGLVGVTSEAATPDAAAGWGGGVAVLWDVESWWALQSPGLPAADIDYLDAVRQAHRVLYRHGVSTDFAHVGDDLSGYRMVLVPCHYLMTDDQADNLRRYVEGGGTLVVSYLSGVADEHARVRLGGYPGALRDLLGIRVEEFHPLEHPVTLSNGATGTLWSEVVQLKGAEALATYPDGTPAITRHGRAVYISTRLTDDALADLIGVKPHPGGPDGLMSHAEGLELVRRGGLLFAINHSAREHPVEKAFDVLTGTTIDRLPPGGVAVLKSRR